MNILVTGANGQLGSEIAAIAKTSADRYVFTDIQECDISDKDSVDALLDSVKADIIVNCAAYTNVDRAEDEVYLADKINHLAAKILADASKSRGITLIHISTDYVFSGERNTPLNEELNTSPLGVYGETKLKGEQAIISSGCSYLIFRTSWLYSEYGNNFVKTIKRLANERDLLKVVVDQVGSPTYAADLAQMICSIIEARTLTDNQGLYHYSNEGVCSWYDFAVEIVSQLGENAVVLPCSSSEFPSKVTRPHYSVLDKSKVKQHFSITIPHWRESLTRCINRLK